MAMRQPLLEGIELALWGGVPLVKKQVTILEMLSETEEGFTYKAYSEDGKIGVLKEFYPEDFTNIFRNEEGQVIFDNEEEQLEEEASSLGWLEDRVQVTSEQVLAFKESLSSDETSDTIQKEKRKFVSEQERVVEKYKALIALRKHEGLQWLLPDYEMYRGSEGKGTTYVWSEQDAKTLAQICETIQHSKPTQTQLKLITLLKLLALFAKGIEKLEKLGYTYDATPDNIGFPKKGIDLQTQHIRLLESDVLQQNQDECQSNSSKNIRLVGESLLHCLRPQGRVDLYVPEYDPYFVRVIEESSLMNACEANRHPKLQKMLTLILQRCLSHRNRCYTRISELVQDLEETLEMALPSSFINRMELQSEWRVQEVARDVASDDKNTGTAILQYLYDHPLYTDHEGERLYVLVMGFGQYGQLFVDACLQLGQMAEKYISIIVVTKDMTDRDIYLEKRPALGEFFNIDHRKTFETDMFGELEFIQMDLPDDPKMCDQKLQQLFQSKFMKKMPSHCFVALGDDARSLLVANNMSHLYKHFAQSAWIGVTVESMSEEKAVIPIPVNTAAPYSELERMAENIKRLLKLPSASSIMEDYFQKEELLTQVVYLKHLCYSLSMGWENRSFDEIAARFSRYLQEEDSALLLALWHRRWVVGKVCQGWKPLMSIEEAPLGQCSDEPQKKHLWLRKNHIDFSKPVFRLPQEQWETASKFDLRQLDDLDRLSVEWHRFYRKKALELQKKNLLQHTILMNIRRELGSAREAVVRYEDWKESLQVVLEDSSKTSSRYLLLHDRFLEAVAELPVEVQPTVKRLIKEFDTLVKPVLLSHDYREFRQAFQPLIEQIPYVLTYTTDTHLVVPFSCGTPTEVFSNVAAASVIRPKAISYLCHVTSPGEVGPLEETLPKLMAFLKNKHYAMTVRLLLILSQSCKTLSSKERLQVFEEKVTSLGISIVTFEELEETMGQQLIETLQQSQQHGFLAIEQNDTWLSAYLQGLGVYRGFEYYRFDAKKRTFHPFSAGIRFGYIKDLPYLNVEDIVGLSQLQSASSQRPEFYDDYKLLWKKYMENSKTWKLLCRVLETHDKNHHQLMYFRQKDAVYKQREEIYRYLVPATTKKSLEKIFAFLMKYHILEEGSMIRSYTTDSCEVILKDRSFNRELYDILLSQHNKLMTAESIELYFDEEDRSVRVIHHNLNVMNVMIDGNRYDDIGNLLQYFERIGYIIRLKFNPDKTVSFTYATRAIKDLLTTAGKILEIYTYHKAKELGGFDDVVSSCELHWQDSVVTNEFDCIMTKGFKTLIVECKARRDIEQNFYYKLLVLSQKFGIHPTVVLIADTQEMNQISANNAMQRERGNMMDVVTIWKSQEITNIGETLMAIIDQE